jgi:hypothetical protein
VAQLTKNNKYKYSLTDIAVIVLSPILATALTIILPFNLLASTILFFGPAALYISWRRKDIILRSLLFTAVVTVISIITDYLAERDQSWASTSGFNFRFAGFVPIEALVWVFLFSYLIIVYFLFFFDHTKHKTVGKRMPITFLAAISVLAWLFLAAQINLHFKIDWFYIKFGLLFILLPLLAFTIRYPKYIRVFLSVMPYFIWPAQRAMGLSWSSFRRLGKDWNIPVPN